VASTWKEQAGILRSLAIYYGVPGRIGRLTSFYRPLIRPGDLCFDIGAHVGNRVLAWRRLGARVVAVEPQQALGRLLSHFYGRSSDVTLVREAVGAAPGTATLRISPTNPTVASLSDEWITAVSRDPSFAGVSWDGVETVTMTTLDALIVRYGEPAFCKIDIEGYEAEALRGLSRPLAALSFEFIPAGIELAGHCLDELARLGRYEFNWFPGESHAWASSRWLSEPEMRQQLAELGRGRASGDIFARRI
jgi:FkbM family methyltransferase